MSWKGFGEVVEKVPERFWGDVLESCWKSSCEFLRFQAGVGQVLDGKVLGR